MPGIRPRAPDTRRILDRYHREWRKRVAWYWRIQKRLERGETPKAIAAAEGITTGALHMRLSRCRGYIYTQEADNGNTE